MKAVYRPYCGGRTKRNGRTSSGFPALEVHGLRRLDDAEVRRYGGEARGVPRVAPLEGLAGHDAGRRAVLQAQDGRVPGGLADARPRRRAPPRAPRRRDPGRARARGAHMLQRREGGLLVHGKVGELEGVVVTDGWSGFAKAVRETWPRTRAQRCTFHAFSQVKRYTTTRPKLQAGREPYLIARDLMGIETLHPCGHIASDEMRPSRHCGTRYSMVHTASSFKTHQERITDKV